LWAKGAIVCAGTVLRGFLPHRRGRRVQKENSPCKRKDFKTRSLNESLYP
jgi:hypothetical protein